jgi:hypothetical protein
VARVNNSRHFIYSVSPRLCDLYHIALVTVVVIVRLGLR